MKHLIFMPWSLIFLFACAANADNRMTLIDYPNASGTWAWGINSRGDIAGYYTGDDKNNHSFLLNGGHYTAIDYPGAAVTLIHRVNPQGDVVGEFGMTATSPHRSFLLGADGVYTTFDFPGAARGRGRLCPRSPPQPGSKRGCFPVRSAFLRESNARFLSQAAVGEDRHVTPFGNRDHHRVILALGVVVPIKSRPKLARFGLDAGVGPGIKIRTLVEDFQSDNIFLDPFVGPGKGFFHHEFQKASFAVS